MMFIQVDRSAFRAKLANAGFYAKWKADLGDLAVRRCSKRCRES